MSKFFINFGRKRIRKIKRAKRNPIKELANTFFPIEIFNNFFFFRNNYYLFSTCSLVL
jgi:hypothetical protein